MNISISFVILFLGISFLLLFQFNYFLSITKIQHYERNIDFGKKIVFSVRYWRDVLVQKGDSIYIKPYNKDQYSSILSSFHNEEKQSMNSLLLQQNTKLSNQFNYFFDNKNMSSINLDIIGYKYIDYNTITYTEDNENNSKLSPTFISIPKHIEDQTLSTLNINNNYIHKENILSLNSIHYPNITISHSNSYSNPFMNNKLYSSKLYYNSNDYTPFYEYIGNDYDITITTHASFNKLSLYMKLVKQWRGPISLCVFIPSKDTYDYSLFRSSYIFKSSTIVSEVHSRTNTDLYPINTLRNIAIKKALTSHIFITDIDIIPTSTLYHTLLTLPIPLVLKPKTAIIVPFFTYSVSPQCQNNYNCVFEKFDTLPKTVPELMNCLDTKECLKYRSLSGEHDYIPSKWNTKAYSISTINIHCFKNDEQKPYILTRKTHQLPLFDERFSTSNYDRQEWIQHLKYHGYSFSIITTSFAYHIPHSTNQYNSHELNTKETIYNNDNQLLYQYFISELQQNMKSNIQTPNCY